MHTDRLLYRWDKKGRVIKDIEKDKIEKRKQYRKERF